MNFTFVSKGIRAAANKSSSPVIYQYDLPGIPHALQRRKLSEADRAFEAKKKVLSGRLPLLSEGEISKYRFPFYLLLLNELNAAGQEKTATEVKLILKEEELQAQQHLLEEKKRLTRQNELLQSIADTLKYSWMLIGQKQVDTAITIRKRLAESLLEEDDKLWLVKLVYESCLKISQRFETPEVCRKTTSEIKCILGYLEYTQAAESEEAVERALELLQEVRKISRGQHWIFQSRIVVVTLKRPVSFIGFREEHETINGQSMLTFNVATLLYHEILLSRAAQLAACEPEDGSFCNFNEAQQLTEQALELALEIHESTSISCAYLTLGKIFLKAGEFSKAMEQFRKLESHADFHRDYETKAIAYNFLGQCFMKMENATAALEMFVKQQEISEIRKYLDLEAEALQKIGRTLLAEGQTMEADLCFQESYHKFCEWEALDKMEKERELYEVRKGSRKVRISVAGDEGNGSEQGEEEPPLPHTRLSILAQKSRNRMLEAQRKTVLGHAWALNAIGAGQNAWGRFAGHCRRHRPKDLEQLAEWKTARHALHSLPSPGHAANVVTDFFTEFESGSKSKIPKRSVQSMVRILVEGNKNLPAKHMVQLPADRKSVAAFEQVIKEEEKKAVNAHKSSTVAVKRVVRVLFAGMASHVPSVVRVMSAIPAEFDEGSERRYSSDKEEVFGPLHDFGRHGVPDGVRNRLEDMESKMPQAKRSHVPRTSLAIHGGISKAEVHARPSLTFRISSISRANSQQYETHYDLRDIQISGGNRRRPASLQPPSEWTETTEQDPSIDF